MASLAAANRDEDFWGPDADDLRLDRAERAPARVLRRRAAPLPRRLAGPARSLHRLRAGGRRFPGLALDGDVTWNGRINLRGPAHLPVSLN